MALWGCVVQVLKFAIDAVKAEAFNPKTLFLFGSYTIGAWGMPLRDAHVRVAMAATLGCLLAHPPSLPGAACFLAVASLLLFPTPPHPL